MMIEAGNKLASISEIITGDMPRSQPATTTLAMIEQGMKLYTSIYKRIYRALKREYGLLFALNARHLPEEQYFTVLDDRKSVAREDYQIGALDIVPVADPTVVTDAQKMLRGQAILDAAVNPAAEGVINKRAAFMRHFEVLGIEDIEELLMPEQQGPSPQEELAMRGMAAEVAGKDATAKKTEAEVEHVRVETDLKAREAAALKQAEAQDFGMEWEKKLREIGDGAEEDEGESEDDGRQTQELS
jgi:chaperonin GroES